jgi:hypothetical protein
MESGRRGHPAEERRHRRRRDDDVAEHTIVENAVHDAPIVNRLVRASDRITKIGGAGIILGGIIGGAAAGLGVRIDSLVRAIDDLRYTVQTMAFVQCVQVRRSYPDLTSADCSPVAPKVTR